MPPVPQPRYLAAGDSALVVEFGDQVDAHVSALVLGLGQKLESSKVEGVIEVVPTFRSLMVHYEPTRLSQANLKAAIAPLLKGLEAAEIVGRRWRLPACYDDKLGLDLAEVAERSGLSTKQVVEYHSTTSQLVYMMGFLPGLPYLGGLPPSFELPRRENPRVKVPFGSVAVAMSMTVIYPQESPGGWHILARTPALLWDMRKTPPSLLAAGDRVTFEPVSVGDYERLLAQANAGKLNLTPESSPSAEARA